MGGSDTSRRTSTGRAQRWLCGGGATSVPCELPGVPLRKAVDLQTWRTMVAGDRGSGTMPGISTWRSHVKVCDPPSVPPATKPHLFRLSVYLGLIPEAVGPRPGTMCSFSTWTQDRPLKQGFKAWEDALHPQPRESSPARLPPPESP